MSAPKDILRLVDQFESNLDSYKSGKYNEAQLRSEFLDPFFKALGWDLDNTQGLAEAYKDVVHEDAIRIGGAVKAPDYCFRIGGTRKFFLEAKKPSVDIGGETSAAYQLRRYAWSAKLPLSILSDFEEFAVYDCRIKPNKPDSAATARVFLCRFQDYPDKWDWIASIFSKDSVLKGSFDKYAETNKAKRGTAEVDDDFLATIERWRSELARVLALRNARLSQPELNFAVQRIIDRIIFLRISEDRGIENYGRLLALTNGPNIYPRLCEIFADADAKFNSGLFHFKAEKDRHEPPDELTLGLDVDDKLLRELLKGLYYPESPYEFTVISSDILGQVYEQFLGKVIRLTAGHHAVVEDKPEVKKAGGVYYTPTYIVDYIVRQTVGKLVEGKTPKQAAKLRVLDPACGSGSFLINAYQYLLDWHRDWYVAHKPEGWVKGRNPVLVQTMGGWKLTIAERKRILLDNICGVDIDPQAVEVTKLSLLLKVLEGESEQTIQPFLRFFQQRALPDLGDNIKCGNSLIGPDFYEQKELPLLDDEERLRINVFDWNAEFPEIIKSGGFDAVIGNPPYIRQEMLGEFKQYFEQHYNVYHGTADLYVYFIERAISLLKDQGIFSYIVANKWMRANYGESLRKWLLTRGIEEIVDFGDVRVFNKVTTYPCILRVRKGSRQKNIHAVSIDTLAFQNLAEYVNQRRFVVNPSSLRESGWSLVGDKAGKLFEKIRQKGIPLEKYKEAKIYRGILTGLNEAFVIDSETKKKLIKEDPKSAELIKPFLLGRDIKRYSRPRKERYLILIPKGWTREKSRCAKDAWEWFQRNYGAIAEHLKPFTKSAGARYDKGDFWWELRACDYYEAFVRPKIIVPCIVQKASYILDDTGFYSNDKTSIIALDDAYLLGLLNSKTLDFIMHSISSTKQGNYFEYKPMYLQQLPIYQIALMNKVEKTKHERIVDLVNQILSFNRKLQLAKTPHEKETLQRQIDATDKQIDQLVYQLYGLTDEEIKIVEGIQ